MPVQIRITSLETPEEFFVFEADTLALVVAKLITELADVWTFAYDESLGTLLKTIAEAIENDEKTAQEWDFSSPGDAYRVDITETIDAEVVDAIQVTEVRPDRPCDADCLRRLAGSDSVECTCSRSEANPDDYIYVSDITDAVKAADVCCPEQVCDRLIAVAIAGGDWRAELDKAKANDASERKALGIAPDASPIPSPKKITSVSQRTQYGDCRVTATFDDGSQSFLFAYYIDELSFSDSEFVGLTQKEAMALRHRKDVAYLRS